MAIENHGFDESKNIYNLTDILNRIEALEAGTALDFNNIYPVGSIYITTSSTNPGTLFPGTTWERYGKGKTIFSVDENDNDFNAPNKTGGSKIRNYTPQGITDGFRLQETHLPSHWHGIGYHTHDVAYRGSKGSKTDSKIYGDYDSNGGPWAVNVLVPKKYPDSAIEDGMLDVRYVLEEGEASAWMKTTAAIDNKYTETTGGNTAHAHTFKAGNLSLNTLSPYITCYIWRRKA